MAVTIEKKFWNGTEYKDIVKVVFTSPNFTSPATAGTRSHIQPGGEYIGTWYEAVDFLYRQKPNQAYVTLPDEMESLFGEFTLFSGTFDFSTDTSGQFWHNYGLDFDVEGLNPSQYPNILYYDKDNYGLIDTCTSGVATISGAEVYTADITFSSVVGSAVISGSLSAYPADLLYHQYSDSPITNDTAIPREHRHTGENSVVFEVTFGEAYNCRLTAWDDNTHSTTINKILDEEHYHVDIVAARSNNSTSIYNANMRTERCMVYPPGLDIPLKGNEKYYGGFDLIFVIEEDEFGEFLAFIPRLVDMDDTFIAGSYDFVTTLHYEYT